MKLLYFFLFILFLNFEIFSQQWRWDTALITSQRIKISTDLQKNFYTYGSDNIVSKYNVNGQLIWRKQYPGTKIKRLVCSEGDYIYITGLFRDSIALDGQKIKSIGGQDIFIAKLRGDGNPFFLNGIGSKSDDDIGDLSINTDEEVFVTGTTYDTTYISGETYPKGINGGLFLAKYDQFGNFKGAKFIHLEGALTFENFGSAGIEIENDKKGNVLLLAEISGLNKVDTSFIRDYYSTYLLQFNSSLDFMWRKKIEDDYFSEVNNLALDSRDNIIYVMHDFGQQSSGATVFKTFLNQPLITQYRLNFYGNIYGIDILSSDNIAFTGYREKWDYSGKRPTIYYLVTGELDINTELVWMKQDSSLKYRCGFNIAELDENKYLVAGSFFDTIVLRKRLTGTEFNQFLAFLNPNARGLRGQVKPKKRKSFGLMYYPDYKKGKYVIVSGVSFANETFSILNVNPRTKKRKVIID